MTDQQSQRREQWEKTKKRRQPERKLVAVEMLFFFSAFLLISLKEQVDLVGILLAFLVPVLIYGATIWIPRLFPADKLLMAIVNFLCALGVLILYSTDGGAGTDRGFQQAMYYGLGLVAMLICILLVRYVRRWRVLIWVLAAGALGVWMIWFIIITPYHEVHPELSSGSYPNGSIPRRFWHPRPSRYRARCCPLPDKYRRCQSAATSDPRSG